MRVLKVTDPNDGSPPPPPPPPPANYKKITIDFDSMPSNTGGEIPTEDGTFPEKEWETLGMIVESKRGKARLLDSFAVRNEMSSLGSPNQKCPTTPTGPGQGKGGEPGKEGENCVPQNMILYIQKGKNDKLEEGKGTIILKFDDSVHSVDEVKLLDVGDGTKLKVVTSAGGRNKDEQKIDVKSKGENAVQPIAINKEGVDKVEINLKSGGAVTSISFTVIVA